MIELDEAWAHALEEAERRARAAGRGDVAEYLALRASNDLVRKTAITWLTEAFMALAGEANRAGADIRIERADGHRFRVGNSTMVGQSLSLRVGVRVLTVEAGWPRTPSDGVVRGGLASANIKHYGNRRADDELMLARAAGGDTPQWLVLEKTGGRRQLLEPDIRQHLTRFLDVRPVR